MTRSFAATVAPTTVPGPETVTEARLPNGMKALVRENQTSPSVVVEGILHGGSLLEPLELPGLAGFTTSMLQRGTKDHTFTALSDQLEAIGAEIGFGAGRHTFGFNAKCLAEDLPDVLALLAEMLATPTFPEPQVDRVRGQLLTGLQQRQSSTRHRAAVAFRRLAYGADHAYGRDPGGTPESIGAIDRDDLVSFYHSAVHPAAGIITLVGAVDAEAAVDALAETVGRWSPGGPPPPNPDVGAPPPAHARRDTHEALPGKYQADVVLGNPAIARSHPDWLAAALGNSVLGVFGLMGRLGDNVRDRRGLAYYAYSRLSGGLGPGPWFAAAGVNPANVDEAVGAILDEMVRLREALVPEAELADVKAYVTGSQPLRLETNEGVAGSLMDIALYGLGLDYLQRFPSLVDAVEPADVQRAARAHLHPESVAVAVAGPPDSA